MKKLKLICLIIFILPFYVYAADSDIRLNSLGFLPLLEKKASIVSSCTDFDVKRAVDDSVAYSGTASYWGTNSDTGEDIYIADFTPLSESGAFYLDVPGVGTSYNFEIGYDIYKEHFYTAARAFYLWRCGMAVSGTHDGSTFEHAACHTNDAYLDYVGGGHVIEDGTGGWHDAGDYGKYIVNAGVTVGVMLKAWEFFGDDIDTITLDIPESGGVIPDYLAEIKYELDWIKKMQMDDGRVYHKLTRTNFSGTTMPEYDTEDRYFVPWSSAATADFTAMMAMASRIYAPYDPTFAGECLDAAGVSYAYLTTNPLNHSADDTGFSTGGYQTTDSDDRLWAAAEMWAATGETEMLNDFETRADTYADKIEWAMDWGNLRDLGMFTYYFCTRTGKNSIIQNDIGSDTVSRANMIVNDRNSHGYARNMNDNYWWGSNGHTVRRALTLYAANRINPNMDYINTAFDAIGFVAGRNYYNRSMITGMGHDPPLNPHHRPSAADGVTPPWPGYLIGGPESGATSWEDVYSSYSTNEVAINWNAGLLIAMAGLLDGVITPTPTVTVTGTPPTLTVTPTITATMTPTPGARQSLAEVYIHPSLVDMTEGENKMCFYNMTEKAVIYIYNLKGELAHKVETNTREGVYCIDLMNIRRKNTLAPGIYIYAVRNENGTMARTGKFAVIR